jgi:hypothetical protein
VRLAREEFNVADELGPGVYGMPQRGLTQGNARAHHQTRSAAEQLGLKSAKLHLGLRIDLTQLQQSWRLRSRIDNHE